MSHTPGPWRRSGDGRQIVDAHGELIARVAAYGPWATNAGLLARAPELYEALKGLSGLLADVENEPECDPEILRAIYTAREAIAKVEGRES